MNDRQRELKKQYKQDQKSRLTDPIINCLECEYCVVDQCAHGQRLYFCVHPRAITLRGAVLYRSVGAECLDIVNAPKECMKRKPCSPECKKSTLDPCETCNRLWGE